MKILLDTHTFIWWYNEPSRLSPYALALCFDRSNQMLLSAASVWELQIKTPLGKLNLALPLGEIIEAQQQTNGLEVLPVTLTHVLWLSNLPAHHKDPFDRLLIAQANVESASLITNDRLLAQYPVHILW